MSRSICAVVNVQQYVQHYVSVTVQYSGPKRHFFSEVQTNKQA